MGQDQLAYSGSGSQAGASLPCAVPPAAMRGIFRRGILRVGNQHRCPAAKIRKFPVRDISIEFVVGGNDERTFSDAKAIGLALLGMPKRMPGDLDAVRSHVVVSPGERLESYGGAEVPQVQRPKRGSDERS